jgi:hypothetical protein
LAFPMLSLGVKMISGLRFLERFPYIKKTRHKFLMCCCVLLVLDFEPKI